jgi:hypothetical protein
MLKYFQLPNYWMWKVYLCVTDEKSDTIVECFKECEGIDLSDVAEEAPCCIIDESNLIGVVCLSDWVNDESHIGVLTHELMHLIIAISTVTRLQNGYAYK